LRQWKTALLGGGAAFASYGIAIWAMTYAPMGQVAAVRESSVCFATVFSAAMLLKVKFGTVALCGGSLCAVGLAALRARLKIRIPKDSEFEYLARPGPASPTDQSPAQIPDVWGIFRWRLKILHQWMI